MIKRRFLFEFLLGLLTIGIGLYYGEKGIIVLSLMIFLPFIQNKKKYDEREYQLFYKTGNYTIGGMIIAMVIIYMCGDIVINNNKIVDNWLNLALGSFFIIHGLIGFINFKND